jgi:glycosyltransferase involved in cell wall biosynthesis
VILIDALFIANHGGGPNLLRYLLDRVAERSLQSHFFLLLDQRFQHDVSSFQHTRMKAGLIARHKYYKNHKKEYSRVFCFANTPPPIKLSVSVDTYFHNQMLLESTRHIFDKKFRRFYLRYLFVKLYNSHTNNYIVQTKHMVDDMVSVGLKPLQHCKTYPFYRLPAFTQQASQRANEFVYISTPSFYKNHRNLLLAWQLLFEQGLRPVLHLTIDDTAPELLAMVQELKMKGINIVNHGYVNPAELYSKCKYLIYPSSNESFGLGLIEAAAAGMKILAANRPYVNSVIRPGASFDEVNPSSIAACVSDALKNDLPFPEILVKDEVDALIEYLIN